MNVKVYGGKTLKGKVRISGSKNAALPIICGSILNKGKVVLKNVTRISDVFDMCKILKYINCKVKFKKNTLIIDSTNINYKPLLLEECQKIRASYYFIGSFLALFQKCEILIPGGCNIGKRPIDYHIKVFTDMGYKCLLKNDILIVTKERNIDYININIPNKSVGASMNAILVGTHFKQGCISNLLVEPECENLVNFLKIMGFNIELFEEKIIYKESNYLKNKVNFSIIPDRIETMTYTVLGLLCGDLVINKCNPKHLLSPLNILVKNGYKIDILQDCLHVYKSVGNQINLKTDVYPGFPTDLQPIFGVLASQTVKDSYIEETVFENRMQIYKDLINSGVECIIQDNKAQIMPSKIISNNYKAYDLRHGAALIILASIGDKDSIISNFEVILRGYEDIIKKLKKIGVNIVSS